MKHKLIIVAICLVITVCVLIYCFSIKQNEEIISAVEVELIDSTRTYSIDDEFIAVYKIELGKVKKLDMSFSGDHPRGATGYDAFPPVISLLTNLEELNFSWNEISDLTPIQSLLHLKKIILPKNKVNNLEGFKNFCDLEYLNIGGNQLTDLKGIENLKKMQYLNVMWNLDLSSLQGVEILPNIRELHIGSDNIQSFPKELLYLKKLKLLELNDISFISMPDSFFTANLPIEELYIVNTSRVGFDFDNTLSKLHNLKNLQKLHLGWNNITKLNIDFEKCENLEEFNFIVQEHINIKDVLNRISKSPKLKQLSLCDNKISYLPNEIALLDSLEVLNLNYNKVRTLPLEITKLKQLKCVFLYGNPIDTTAIKKIEKAMVNTEFCYDK